MAYDITIKSRGWELITNEHIAMHAILYILPPSYSLLLIASGRGRTHSHHGQKQFQKTTHVLAKDRYMPGLKCPITYLEHMSLYFEANVVAKDKQVVVLLTAIGGKMFVCLIK